MKFLQKVFVIYLVLFGCFLKSSLLQASDYQSEELLHYSQCPPSSALWPLICTGADLASGFIAVSVPSFVCGFLGADSVHCQIFSSVVGGMLGSAVAVLTPLSGYMWYDYYWWHPQREENSKEIINLIDCIKTPDPKNPNSNLSAVGNDELSQKLLLAYAAGYFVYKSEILDALKLFDKNQTRELKNELKNNEKIGFLAGLDIPQIVEIIISKDLGELENDKAIFSDFILRLRDLKTA